MFYLILFSVVSCLTIYSFIKPVNKVNRYIFIALWLLVVIAFPIGRDFNMYLKVFDRVASPIADAFKYDTQRNIGFNMMIYYCKQIVGDYAFFRLVFNVIVSLLCGYTIYKYSKNIVLSMFLFLFNGIFLVWYGSGIRQMMAMAIFFYAYFNFLLKDKDWLYLLCCVLSISFHDLGVVTFLIYPLYKCRNIILKNSKKYMLGMIGVGIIMCVFITFGMPRIVDIVGYETPLKHGLIYFKNSTFSLTALSLRTVLLMVNTTLYMLSAQNREENDRFMYLTMFVNYCLFISFSSFGVFARMYDFVAIIELAMIPNFISKIGNKRMVWLSLMAIMGLIFVLFYVDLNEVSYDDDYQLSTLSYPYTTIFEGDKVYELVNYK